jgi:hypothetical protein
MGELEYPCPFKPRETCTCSSGFARSIFQSVVNGLVSEGVGREEAIKAYIDYINSKPILPIEVPKYSGSCIWSSSAFIEVKKKH